jgi:hypothetical protein
LLCVFTENLWEKAFSAALLFVACAPLLAKRKRTAFLRITAFHFCFFLFSTDLLKTLLVHDLQLVLLNAAFREDSFVNNLKVAVSHGISLWNVLPFADLDMLVVAVESVHIYLLEFSWKLLIHVLFELEVAYSFFKAFLYQDFKQVFVIEAVAHVTAAKVVRNRPNRVFVKFAKVWLVVDIRVVDQVFLLITADSQKQVNHLVASEVVEHALEHRKGEQKLELWRVLVQVHILLVFTFILVIIWLSFLESKQLKRVQRELQQQPKTHWPLVLLLLERVD